MADSADVVSQVNSIIRSNWNGPLYSIMFPTMPLVGVMAAKYGDKNKSGQGLGVPDSSDGVLFAGNKQARLYKPKIMSSSVWSPPFIYATPPETDGKPMPFGATTPSVANFSTTGPETRQKRAAFKWVPMSDPAEVDKDRINQTTTAAAGETAGWEAIGSLMVLEGVQRASVQMERLNQMWWGVYSPSDGSARFSNSGAPSNESNETWDAVHSLPVIAGASRVYAGIDPAVTGNLLYKGNTISAATAPSFLEMLRFAQHELYGDGTGLSKFNAHIDVMFTGGALYSAALREAEANTGGMRIIPAGQKIPAMGDYGLQQDVILINGRTAIIEDPTAPAATVIGMNTETFFVAFKPNQAFTPTKPNYLGDRPGEPRAMYWNVDTAIMSGCLAPRIGIVAWTNVG